MRKTLRKDRGFTLVELMVSLVAGLIVTIAVVGLARAATTTFFEAARISSVQSTARTASERLRQDLSRAGYMSTGNIKLAKDGTPGVPQVHRIAVYDPGALSGSRYAGLDDLQGVHIIVGGSGASPIPGAGTAGPNALSVNNGLNPDAIILGGNYTTDDSYTGQLVAGGACGPQTVQLDPTRDGAVRRLLAAASPLAAVQAAFTPVPASLFAAKVVDGNGCQNYVVVCGAAIVGGRAEIYLAADKNGKDSVVTSIAGAGTGTCGSAVPQDVTISPVQRVRWYIGPNTNAALDPAAGVEVPGNKFNLYREFLDAASPPAPIPATRQIIAEYAVDLKFGITVANAANALQVFEMDTDPGGGLGTIDSWTQNASGTTAGGAAPQRVRSVRFRIVTRAAVPDRRNSLVIGPPPYMTRYCVENSTVPLCKNFARARTVVTEVALLNQLGMSF